MVLGLRGEKRLWKARWETRLEGRVESSLRVDSAPFMCEEAYVIGYIHRG